MHDKQDFSRLVVLAFFSVVASSPNLSTSNSRAKVRRSEESAKEMIIYFHFRVRFFLSISSCLHFPPYFFQGKEHEVTFQHTRMGDDEIWILNFPIIIQQQVDVYHPVLILPVYTLLGASHLQLYVARCFETLSWS
uniref:Uncharacterized protein n=1 Tax=uncultured bacterium fosmid pJB135F11 TaxID=1478051 RepID=A0A0H3UAW0_9BACT|nr:hypothetical protein [uncultured bacterium fosmid pJB135F11]